MKIALLGAPGAGKTRIARELRAALAEKYGAFVLIDNYVQQLEKRTNFAYGHFASYVPNLTVALDRTGIENKHADNNTITCGTIFDTISYTILHGREAARFSPEGQLEMVRANATLGTMGMLVADTFNYNYAFYLPYSEKAKTKRSKLDVILDATIPLIVEENFMHITRLEGTIKEKVDFAVQIIDKLEDAEETDK